MGFTNASEAETLLEATVSELRGLGYDRLRSMNSTRLTLLGGLVQIGGSGRLVYLQRR